ncbi:hypothetical protein [Psychrobacillus sp. BL-248-WT-3]|uniref:hypothetical protein n=1 Tax=Psychrobacillus sp. BL-248-WT-3 TaxID=2725306 RepID=UPI00146E624E|nr:hypothetical protein [Psychrobacillus sp. BL-248-WT-3]NME06222.1 hypothetical protein [Psychrobacillus sp. BL-248-WT-3]
MTNQHFWTSLSTGWSKLQGQATNTKFNSELLAKAIHAQISNAKEIRNNYYRSDGFLAYADDDDEDDIY